MVGGNRSLYDEGLEDINFVSLIKNNAKAQFELKSFDSYHS